MSYKHLRIAIICANASFKMSGEAAIPLRHYLEYLKLGASCTLLTHSRVREELRQLLTPEQFAGVVFEEDNLAQVLIYKASLHFPERIRELFFYNAISMASASAQVKRLRELVKTGRSNVVHQPTPISPRSPSMASNLGCPVFIGPLNGGIDFPPMHRARGGRMVQSVINLGRMFSEPLNYLAPGKKNASAVFVCNKRTRKSLPRAMRSTPIINSFDNGINLSLWANVKRTPARAQFVVVSRLVNWKAIDVAVKATLRLKGKAKLKIIGDGPERPRLEALCADTPGSVEFLGKLPHQEIVPHYNTATALIMPSLREAGGTSVMEAQGAGLPIIATAWGGLLDFVDHGENGLLIDINTDMDGFVSRVASAMRQLIEDPELVKRLGSNAKNKAILNYGWSVKAKNYLDTFSEFLKSGVVTHKGYETCQ